MPIVRRLVALSAIFLTFGVAVEPGKPSRTAVFVLQWRALGTTIPEPELRNPDTLAVRFFGERERQVLQFVWQDGILRPIGNRPVGNSDSLTV
jgi:hypothetical protein